jgi:hypothetical protein
MLFSDYPDGDFSKIIFTIEIPKCIETATVLAGNRTIAAEKAMLRSASLTVKIS